MAEDAFRIGHPIRGVLDQQVVENQVVRGPVLQEDRLILHLLFDNVSLCAALEGGPLRKHLVKEAAESPIVACVSRIIRTVAPRIMLLWRHILNRAHGRLHFGDLGELLRDAKIRQLDIARAADEYVLWLEVPHDDANRVQVDKPLQNLPSVAFNRRSAEPFIIIYQVEEVAALAILQREAPAHFRLEELHESDDRIALCALLVDQFEDHDLPPEGISLLALGLNLEGNVVIRCGKVPREEDDSR